MITGCGKTSGLIPAAHPRPHEVLISISNLPVDALRRVWQDQAAIDESEKQFSFTHAILRCATLQEEISKCISYLPSSYPGRSLPRCVVYRACGTAMHG